MLGLDIYFKYLQYDFVFQSEIRNKKQLQRADDKKHKIIEKCRYTSTNVTNVISI